MAARAADVRDDRRLDAIRVQGPGARGNDAEASRHWIRTWTAVATIARKRGFARIEEFDEVFDGTQFVFNWVQDMDEALCNAGREEPWFWEETIRIADEVLRLFPNESQLFTENKRRWIAESHAKLGRRDVSDELYRNWLVSDPAWGWGWIGWADTYFPVVRDDARDTARAEAILRQGLAVADVRDRADLLDRLAAIYEDSGRESEAAEVRRRIDERKAAPEEASVTVSSDPETGSGRVSFDFGDEGLPLEVRLDPGGQPLALRELPADLPVLDVLRGQPLAHPPIELGKEHHGILCEVTEDREVIPVTEMVSKPRISLAQRVHRSVSCPLETSRCSQGPLSGPGVMHAVGVGDEAEFQKGGRLPADSGHRERLANGRGPRAPWGRAALLDGRRGRPETFGETQEEGQPLVDRVYLRPRKLSEHPADPPLVDRSQMIDQGAGRLGESARAGLECRVEGPLALGARDGDHAHERKTLVADHVRIAHDHARADAALLVSHRWIEIEQDNRPAVELHSEASTQPSPGTQRTGFPARTSTSSVTSSSGRPLAQSSKPSSASCAQSGCGLRRERRSASRRRRSISWRTASRTNRLRFVSIRSMSCRISAGRVTVTRSVAMPI
jgi:hypothetical protein